MGVEWRKDVAINDMCIMFVCVCVCVCVCYTHTIYICTSIHTYIQTDIRIISDKSFSRFRSDFF